MIGHSYGAAAARASAEAIRKIAGDRTVPVAGIILGSGLGGLAKAIEGAVRIPYRDVPGFPSATVVGHAGELIVGTLEGRAVAALAGRFHMYEGHDPALAGFPARVLHALGAPVLVVSNAAGGIRSSFRPGTLMLIEDHLNLMFRNPLTGAQEEGDTRFPDMSDPYDRELRQLAKRAAATVGVELEEGVYAGLLGPTYETRAEVKMLATLGADATGMSTVPEVIVARAMGMRVVGITCVTNLACGLSDQPITHAEVIETTDRVTGDFQRLVREIVRTLP
ncbi:MAG: Purine nucleoside phosphorylase [Gemmatimonadetes bacterium]|nr:Purine nucleoside phosphorylase [Gemmatimonadota bacterium]